MSDLDSAKPPMEWWIVIPDGDEETRVFNQTSRAFILETENDIHVIEYSHYEKIKAERDRYKAALESSTKTLREINHNGICAGSLKHLLQASIELSRQALGEEKE